MLILASAWPAHSRASYGVCVCVCVCVFDICFCMCDANLNSSKSFGAVRLVIFICSVTFVDPTLFPKNVARWLCRGCVKSKQSVGCEKCRMRN